MTCCAAVSAGATWQQAAPVHCGALALLAAPQLLRRDDGMVVPLGPRAALRAGLDDHVAALRHISPHARVWRAAPREKVRRDLRQRQSLPGLTHSRVSPAPAEDVWARSAAVYRSMGCASTECCMGAPRHRSTSEALACSCPCRNSRSKRTVLPFQK